jgi:fumarate reductase subunit D
MNEPDAGGKYDLGVLLVHGIGNQTLGSTLTAFGTPLVEWLRARAKRTGAKAELGTTVLTATSDEPASSELTISSGNGQRRWLLAESWWAQSFPTAQFRDVAKWSLLIVPWTIGTHFAKRLSRAKARKRFGSRLSAGAALVGALLLSPVLLLILAMLLLLGMIPWPQLQNALAKIQLAIASSLGDSFMLVTRPLEAAAIRSRVRRDLDWMLRKCGKVAVVAHSQGGAIACQVLSAGSSTAGLLITFGSGLRKLEELDDARRRGRLLQGAMLSVAGLFLAGLMISAAPQVAYQAYRGSASPASLLTLLALAAAGIAIGIAGLQDFIHATEPTSLTVITTHLALRGVQWEDVYSSADPVPNGTLHDDGRTPPNSTEVVNFGSGLRDHTSYWHNRDEFVALIGEKLLAFDGARILEPARADVAKFLRRQRAIRVAVLQTLGWATALCAAALLLRYYSEWLSVAAWGSHRALAWIGNLVGYVPPAVTTPDAVVWRRSVGWLAAVLAASWVARTWWALWNNAAMEDAERGVYRVREPLGVLLALFLQLFLSAIAVFSFSGWAFTAAGCGVLAVLIGVAVAQGRHPAPEGAEQTEREARSSSAILVWHALKNLVLAGVMIVGVPMVLISGALSSQKYLAPRFGTGPSWAVAAVLMLVGAVLAVAAIRGILEMFRGKDGKAGNGPPA